MLGGTLDDRTWIGGSHEKIVARRTDGRHGREIRESYGGKLPVPRIVDGDRPADERFGIIEATFDLDSQIA